MVFMIVGWVLLALGWVFQIAGMICRKTCEKHRTLADEAPLMEQLPILKTAVKWIDRAIILNYTALAAFVSAIVFIVISWVTKG